MIPLVWLQTNSFWLTVAAFCAISLCYWFHRPKDFPPGPRGIPFLGVAPYFGKHAAQVLAEYGKKYGNVMSYKLASSDWIVLNDLEAINEGLLKQGADFSGRPYSPVIDALNNGHGIVFVDSGDFWKSQRKFGLKVLRSFGMGKVSYEKHINTEIDYLLKAVESYNSRPFDVINLVKKCMTNSLCRILFGERFDYEDDRLQAFIEQSPSVSFAVRIPILRFIPPFRGEYLHLVKNTKDFLDILQAIIDEHKETYDPGNPRDFIDAFFDEMSNKKSSSQESSFTEKQLLHFTQDLLVGGIDSSAATIGWGIICLLHNPSCEKKIHDEIASVVGSDPASMKHQGDMPYLCAFIHEVQRCNTLAPLNMPHCTKKDVYLKGYRIPKGTMVMANIWNSHNDPRVWKDPAVFAPERHLSSSGRFVKSDHVIPFSVGYRRCLGEQLAKVGLFLFFVNFLRRFKLEVEPTEGLPGFEKNPRNIFVTPLTFHAVAKQR